MALLSMVEGEAKVELEAEAEVGEEQEWQGEGPGEDVQWQVEELADSGGQVHAPATVTCLYGQQLAPPVSKTKLWHCIIMCSPQTYLQEK